MGPSLLQAPISGCGPLSLLGGPRRQPTVPRAPAGPPPLQLQPLAQAVGGGLSGAIASRTTDPLPAKARRVKDNFVNRVAEQCGPAVVRVETEQHIELPGISDGDIFSFFFGVKPEGRRQERRVRSHGSGFCIDGQSGVILTNAHVVQGADRISVLFAGRSTPLECEVLETDEVIDLAAVRVKGPLKAPLPAMALGSSETVRTGDWAIVLGNPFGLRNTCTLGIVSSLDRSTGETGFDWMRHPLLQTDAAVNQGNSGGPVLNELGEVVGIVSMRALFGEGIGFAIPVDSARAALPSLLDGRKVPRAYVGIKMSNSPFEFDEDSKRHEGVTVETVLPGSPAEAAGFQVDDRIVEVEGRRVRQVDEVQSAIRAARVGVSLSFKVKREGKPSHLSPKTADIRQLREGGGERGGRAAGRPHVMVLPPR